MDWTLVKEVLKLIPGTLLLPFSLYLIWKKIGTSASASIQIKHDRLSGSRVSSITIQNIKDKPLVIRNIYLMIDKDHYLTLKKFDTPMIIKGLEIANIVPDEVSSYHIGGDEIEDLFSGRRVLSVFITTQEKTFRCSEIKSFNEYRPRIFKGIPEVSTVKNSFNGVVFTKKALFAVCYKDTNGEHIALIDEGGLIGRDWDYLPNLIAPEDMTTAAHIEAILKNLNIAKQFKWIYVQDLTRI
ncbi:hypothetical protein [Pseudomonas fulva]|uniref:hypothetical protein n=1 Tax=Pseudomonas fulva TaxID=47880 RepID=UPI003BF5A3A1